MDYRGRIYPISAVLTYISADPYRASFKFREGRKLGGVQEDGYTGFEWLLIHAVSVSDKKKKATHEECLSRLQNKKIFGKKIPMIFNSPKGSNDALSLEIKKKFKIIEN